MLTTYLTAVGVLVTLALPVRADLVILQYHHISDDTPASTSTNVGLFRAHLERIQTLGLEVVPLDSGTEAALSGQLEDREQVAITFDDAYDSVWNTAAPLLEEYGYPYTIFVNTRAVGSLGYMSWEQLAQASRKQGVLIGNHSHDHAHLPRRPGESREHWHRRAADSLDRAQSLLQDRLTRIQPLFAYPYGEYDNGVEAMVDDREWFGYGQQSGAVGPGSDPSRLPRFPMATAYGQLQDLNIKLRSLALPVDASELPDGIMAENPPPLTLTLPEGLSPSALNCFASGQGRIPAAKAGERTVTVQAPEAFNARRFRYNCTYPAGHGRFYWLSQQWVDLSQQED